MEQRQPTSDLGEQPRDPWKSSLAALMGLLGIVLVVAGTSGLLHEWEERFSYMGFVRLLVPDAYEIHSYVVMIVLGVALGIAGNMITRRTSR
jgi:hypothetical protein